MSNLLPRYKKRILNRSILQRSKIYLFCFTSTFPDRISFISFLLLGNFAACYFKHENILDDFTTSWWIRNVKLYILTIAKKIVCFRIFAKKVLGKNVFLLKVSLCRITIILVLDITSCYKIYCANSLLWRFSSKNCVLNAIII